MKTQMVCDFRSDNIAYNHVIHTEIEPYVIEPHCHDIFEIIYLKNGDLTYNIEGKRYHIKKNNVILAKPFLIHSINVNSPEIYDRHAFLFENSLVKDTVFDRLSPEMNVINLTNYPEILKIFTKADFYSQHFKGDELKNILSNIVEEIIYNIIIVLENFSQNNINGNYSANPVIASAVEFINDNIAEPFNIEDICKKLFISKSHLHGLFSKHMQTTPQKYIAEKRLLMAQKEIRNLKKPTDIYNKCGFYDYSSFYRAYKKYFGYPPSEELDHEIVRVIEF